MNCQVCGTQLPAEARACPNCGTLTPTYYGYSGASPYDATVPVGSGSSPAGMSAPPPPPTQYGTDPHDSPLQSPYPFNPYEAPPPPPTRRSGKRIGIIVGLVLLVLLLIGGGVLAWLLHSSAAANFTSNGTFTILDHTISSQSQNGQDKIYGYTEHGVNNGDLRGSYTDMSTETVHPDNTGNFSGNETCTCTVAGKSSTLTYSFSGTFAADGSFQGQVFSLQGTGDLANLHGQGTFQGKGNNGTYIDQLHFDG